MNVAQKLRRLADQIERAQESNITIAREAQEIWNIVLHDTPDWPPPPAARELLNLDDQELTRRRMENPE